MPVTMFNAVDYAKIAIAYMGTSNTTRDAHLAKELAHIAELNMRYANSWAGTHRPLPVISRDEILEAIAGQRAGRPVDRRKAKLTASNLVGNCIMDLRAYEFLTPILGFFLFEECFGVTEK